MFSTERAILYADNPMLAQPVVQYLRDHGIDASTLDPDDLGGLDPALTFSHGTAIVVPSADADRARELALAFEAAEADDAADGAGDASQ